MTRANLFRCAPASARGVLVTSIPDPNDIFLRLDHDVDLIEPVRDEMLQALCRADMVLARAGVPCAEDNIRGRIKTYLESRQSKAPE